MRILLRKCLGVTMALLTVWCVGCSAFEPLLNEWTGGTEPAGAERAANSYELPTAAATATDASAPSTSERAVTSGPALAIQPSILECSCICGHAIVPADGAASKLLALSPSAAHHAPITLLSVTRQPLVPPPIA